MDKRYRFNSLQTFCGNEWIVNNLKRYPTIFDTAELDYHRVQLVIYSRLFDEDGAGKDNLKCFDVNGKVAFCDRDLDLEVKKEVDIFFSDAAHTYLKEQVTEVSRKCNVYFGDARSVGQMVGEIVMKKNLHLASSPAGQRNKNDLQTLAYEE